MFTYCFALNSAFGAALAAAAPRAALRRAAGAQKKDLVSLSTVVQKTTLRPGSNVSILRSWEGRIMVLGKLLQNGGGTLKVVSRA